MPTLQLLAIAVLIVLNALLVMTEMALVSSTPLRLRQMASEGHAGAKKVLKLLEDPADFLSAVQGGVTLIGVLTGAVGGAALSTYLSDYLDKISLIQPYSEPLAFGIVVATLTYFTLVLGELAPKNLGIAYPERIAVIGVRPILFLVMLTRPLVQFLSWSTRLSLRLIGFRGADRAAVTEEEVQLLIEEGTRAGALEPQEETMMKRIIRLGDRDVGDVMTPRTQIQAIDIQDTLEENIARIKSSYHSYLPVYDDTKDEIVGMFSVKTLFAAQESVGDIDLMSGLQEPLFIPESMPAYTALEEFRRSGKHIAVVVDEYGGTAGLLTIIDIMEAIVGEVPDEAEVRRPDMLQRRDGSWLVAGMAGIDDFKETLGIKHLEAEEEGDFQSVAGLVLHHLGRIPSEGDEVEADGYHFEVIDMDGRRVDKLLVSKAEPPREGSQERDE